MKLTYTRETNFSAAYRCWNLHFDSRKNLEIYGDQATLDPMGQNYLVKVTAQSPITSSVLKKIEDNFHKKYLNKDILSFREQVPTIENIVECCWNFLIENEPNLLLRRVQIFEGKKWFCEKHWQGDGVILSHVCKINCVHRHHNPDLSSEENAQLYGLCSKVHGHEYTLEVGLEGVPNKFGQVLPRQEFEAFIKEHVISVYHKTFLNDKVGNASGEVITHHIYNHLKKIFSVTQYSSLKLHLSLRETRKNSFHITYNSESLDRA